MQRGVYFYLQTASKRKLAEGVAVIRVPRERKITAIHVVVDAVGGYEQVSHLEVKKKEPSI
jgi:hypothetical protein